jgi:metal-responsive CopG/Arc/MetJ family transcriptional regulator
MPDDPSPPASRIAIPMPQSLIDRIDDWRFENRIASRAEAVRTLLETALTVKRKDQTK